MRDAHQNSSSLHVVLDSPQDTRCHGREDGIAQRVSRLRAVLRGRWLLEALHGEPRALMGALQQRPQPRADANGLEGIWLGEDAHEVSIRIRLEYEPPDGRHDCPVAAVRHEGDGPPD